jgi:hypothetical protein
MPQKWMKRTQITLATLHVLIAIYISLAAIRSVDGTMLFLMLYFLDFPFSLIVFLVDKIFSLPLFWPQYIAAVIILGVGGTIWWYFVPVFIQYLYKKMMKFLKWCGVL